MFAKARKYEKKILMKQRQDDRTLSFLELSKLRYYEEKIDYIQKQTRKAELVYNIKSKFREKLQKKMMELRQENADK